MIFDLSANSGEAYKVPVLEEAYPADATVVGGNSTTLKVEIATAGNPDTYTYQWYENGAAISGATASTYAFTPSAKGTTTFYCAVTNEAGTVNSRTATITCSQVNLYGSGKINTAFTGGLKAYAYRPSTSQSAGVTPTVTQNTATITVAVTEESSGGTYSTQNAIDLTNFQSLHLDVTSLTVGDSQSYVRLGVTKTREQGYTVAAAQSMTKAGEWSVDVSGLSGKYYVFINMYGASSKKCTFTRWWLK